MAATRTPKTHWESSFDNGNDSRCGGCGSSQPAKECSKHFADLSAKPRSDPQGDIPSIQGSDPRTPPGFVHIPFAQGTPDGSEGQSPDPASQWMVHRRRPPSRPR